MVARFLTKGGIAALTAGAVACGGEAVPNEAPAADRAAVETRRVWADADGLVGVSPDGRLATYTDWRTGDIALRDLETGEVRSITGNTRPFEHGFGMTSAWSPDGERVAVAWDPQEHGDGYDMRVVTLATGEIRTVHAAPGTSYLHVHEWTPDGRTVVAQRTTPDGANQIVLVDAEDGELTALRTLGWQWSAELAVSPDGRWIAYETSASEDPFHLDVRILAADGSDEEVVLATPADERLLGWSADGAILALTDEGDEPSIVRVPIRSGRAAAPPTTIVPDAWHVRPVGRVADGRFFYTVRSGTREAWEVALDRTGTRVAGSPQRLFRPHNEPVSIADYSPDGRHVLLRVAQTASAPGAGAELAVRSVETGETRTVRTRPRLLYLGTPRWIPGTHAAVARARLSGDRTSPSILYRVDLQSGEATPLTEPDPEEHLMGYSLTVSPDGSTVYFQTEETPSHGPAIYRIRAQALDEPPGTGRLVWRIPDGLGEGRPRARIFEISPDGSTLALRFGWQESVGEYRSSVLLLPASGGEPTELVRLEGTEGAMAFHPRRPELWMVTGEAFGLGESHALRRVDLETGSVEEAGLQRPGLGMGAALFGAGLRFSPDGERLAFTAGQTRVELWAMEMTSESQEP